MSKILVIGDSEDIKDVALNNGKKAQRKDGKKKWRPRQRISGRNLGSGRRDQEKLSRFQAAGGTCGKAEVINICERGAQKTKTRPAPCLAIKRPTFFFSPCRCLGGEGLGRRKE